MRSLCIRWLVVLCAAGGCFATLQHAFAQQAVLRMTPEAIRIGEHCHLIIDLEIPSEGALNMPFFDGMLTGDIEILRTTGPDTLHVDERLLTMQKTYVITAWEEGYFPVPRMEFVHISGPDTTYFATQAALLQVEGIEVDLAQPYRDIHPIFSIPVGLWEILRRAFPLLVVGVAVYFLVVWLRNHKKKPQQESLWEKPGVPAHIAAISGLESLRRKNLWQNGHIKQYHSELTDILRKYLYKRYGIHAMEMTTHEIMENISGHINEPGLEKGLKNILQTADLVKFARYRPGDTVHENALETALELVKKTIPDVA